MLFHYVDYSLAKTLYTTRKIGVVFKGNGNTVIKNGNTLKDSGNSLHIVVANGLLPRCFEGKAR
jgi:hypothetical protein